jgi:hypothetical protein
VNVDSLEELAAAFGEWRRTKRHLREAMPPQLVDRARRAAEVHGRGCVARAVKVDSGRLRGACGPGGTYRRGRAAPPSYSRVELVSATSTRPFAELEMPSGVKLRFYSQTQETVGLLTSLCGAGGAR